MSFQSSFLIRCRLSETDKSGTSTTYYIQHVQSGIKFRSASFEEVTAWLMEQNLLFMANATTHVKETGQ